MDSKDKLFKIINRITMVIITITIVSCSLCFADPSSPPDSEMMAAFSDSINTELGDKVNVLLEGKGLQIDLGNGVITTAMDGEVYLIPLLSKDSRQMTIFKEYHQKSQFLAYINHEMLGRFLVILEVLKSQSDERPSTVRIVFPSGRGLLMNMNPLCIYQIDASQTGIFLQDNDDLENSIIVSDTCDVIGIIAIVLTAACMIFHEPILCAIAVAMQSVYQFLC